MKFLHVVFGQALSLITATILALAIGASPGYALVLKMHLTVSPNESPALEESIGAIHSFFLDQPGFIEAELTKESREDYELTEEWSSLKSYQDAVRLPGFQQLAKSVPGSSNWRAETLFE
jgi:hypothetical protein